MINEKDLDTIINDVTWSYEECGGKVPQNILDTLNEIKQVQAILDEYNITPEILREVLLTGQMFRNQSTLDDCIKEWEEKGWELSDIHKHLDLGTNYYFLEKDMPHRNLNININYKQIRCSDSNGNAEELELDELELAIKTLKALEVENDN